MEEHKFFTFFMEKSLDILSQPLERMTNVNNDLAICCKKYECKTCDYNSHRLNDYEKHIKTTKHINLQLADKSHINSQSPLLVCNCGKDFKHRQSLWKHRQKCPTHLKTMPNNELIMFLLKENKEFKEMIIEQSSKMLEQNDKLLEFASKPTTINNNNNSNTNCHNKQFNLQVFLNEKCKNAMSMSDFVSSLEIMTEDLEDMGKLGYVQGISNIFMKGLKDLDETERPIHCTDKKRETLYIKNGNVWDKDDNREKMKIVIKEMAHKNFKYIPIWTDANPSYNDGTTKKNDQYMRIVNQVMTCISPDDDSGFNKIIKNVASRVCIDKEA
jgi:hypothetical protein